MTKVSIFECDSCGARDSSEFGENIAQCYICNKDFCTYCQLDHAEDETGFRLNKEWLKYS